MPPPTCTTPPSSLLAATSGWRRRAAAILAPLALLAALACQGGEVAPGETVAGRPEAAEEGADQPGAGGDTEALFRNVHLVIAPGLTLEIEQLRGRLRRTDPKTSPFFDQPSTFGVAIDEADVALSAATLETLMNRYVFGYEGAPLSDLRVSFEEPYLVTRGELHQPIDISFQMKSEPSVTADGKVRLHPVEMKAGGVGVKGLLDLFDVELQELLQTRPGSGVRFVDDDLLLSPAEALPPPRVTGHLARVAVRGDRFLQHYVADREVPKIRPPVDVAGTLYFRGGTLRFGKLIMHDADLQLADADPADPLLYDQAGYLDQLVAGYSKTQQDKGLVTWIPDADQTGASLRP